MSQQYSNDGNNQQHSFWNYLNFEKKNRKKNVKIKKITYFQVRTSSTDFCVQYLRICTLA